MIAIEDEVGFVNLVHLDWRQAFETQDSCLHTCPALQVALAEWKKAAREIGMATNAPDNCIGRGSIHNRR